MRTDLPTTFAELTIVKKSETDDDIVETKQQVLIKAMDVYQVTAIDKIGVTVDLPMYSDYVDETPRVATIKMLSNEDDDFQEFIMAVQYADMAKAMHKIASYVKKEFKTIINVVPEDNQSLLTELRNMVLDV